MPLLAHANELIAKLDVLGISSSPADADDDDGSWEDKDGGSEAGDGDVDMS
jgi:hypothetical protein